MVYASVAKKDMQHTNVLFTGTTKSPFSTPHTYLYNYWADLYKTCIFYALYIYMHDFTYLTYVPNLKKMGSVAARYLSLKITRFLHFCTIFKSNFEPTLGNLFMHRFHCFEGFQIGNKIDGVLNSHLNSCSL